MFVGGCKHDAEAWFYRSPTCKYCLGEPPPPLMRNPAPVHRLLLPSRLGHASIRSARHPKHAQRAPRPAAGLPEEVAHTKQCLARGYAVLALTSKDRVWASRCFSSSGNPAISERAGSGARHVLQLLSCLHKNQPACLCIMAGISTARLRSPGPFATRPYVPSCKAERRHQGPGHWLYQRLAGLAGPAGPTEAQSSASTPSPTMITACTPAGDHPDTKWALRTFTAQHGLRNKPIYMFGISSGASFAVKFPGTMAIQGLVSGASRGGQTALASAGSAWRLAVGCRRMPCIACNPSQPTRMCPAQPHPTPHPPPPSPQPTIHLRNGPTAAEVNQPWEYRCAACQAPVPPALLFLHSILILLQLPAFPRCNAWGLFSTTSSLQVGCY